MEENNEVICVLCREPVAIPVHEHRSKCDCPYIMCVHCGRDRSERSRKERVRCVYNCKDSYLKAGYSMDNFTALLLDKTQGPVQCPKECGETFYRTEKFAKGSTVTSYEQHKLICPNLFL